MSTIKTNKNGSNFIGKQVIETKNDSKHFYQYFSVYLIAIFLVVIIALSSGIFLLSQQAKSSKALITEQLIPFQAQLLQQAYLINTNKLIDSILQNKNVHKFTSLQQALSRQSEKLSSLNSQYKVTYQQWFDENIITTNLATRIHSNHEDNELLRNKLLIQLDTLLDGIRIQLRNLQSPSDHAILLPRIESELASIVVMLNSLSLQTSREMFEQLNKKIDEILTVDYSKKLANQQNHSQAMADIVRDFIRFEDILLKSKILSNWDNNLLLMGSYQLKMIAQKRQLNNIFDEFSHNIKNKRLLNSDYSTNRQVISEKQLPYWILVIFSLTLFSVAILLWLTRRRIRFAIKQSVTFIEQALANEQLPLITTEQADMYSAEFEQLAKKIQHINSRHYSELEFLTLLDKNKELEDKVIKSNVNKEQLKRELELVEFNALSKSESQLLLEQQRCKALYLGAIKQLVLLGSSAVTTISTDNEDSVSTKSNDLYYAHLQGRELIRKLRQASCHRYLQSGDAVLTLSDINLDAHVHGILLNLRNKLFISKNKILLTIDERIFNEVHLDAELFSELLRAFIRLLFSQQTDKQLTLSLKLIDKNNGQQKVSFIGEIQGNDEIVQLPESLQALNDEGTKPSELGDYFNTLLRYQHGEDVNRKATDNGYQLSFILPLAVINNQQEQKYSVLSLPDHSLDIETVCVKLSAKYIYMPIEVLLAVKSPEKYQRLQQLLQSIGLQVTFVTCERMLQKSWKSGRFTVLMTELDCQPFTRFIIDEDENTSARKELVRGVFNLVSSINIPQKPAEYSDWVIGSLNAQSAVTELTMMLMPWIKEQKNKSEIPSNVSRTNFTEEHINAERVAEKLAASFNFERYIKHQGSAELAIFMLQEYTTENTGLVEQLCQEFMDNNTQKVESIIQKLFVNSKILAAEPLLNLCQSWQKSLATKGLDNCDKVQMILLSKTKEAIQDINLYADTVA